MLSGLPSIADTDGSAAIGAADVAVDHGRYAVLVGLGADPAVREQEGAPEFADQLGTLLTGTFRGRRRSWKATSGKAAHPSYGYGPRIAADVSAYEAEANPDGAQVDSNPVGLWSGRYGWVVADAGGNDVLHVSWWGRTSTLGVFPTRLVPPRRSCPRATSRWTPCPPPRSPAPTVRSTSAS